jgi:hypothetical protein
MRVILALSLPDEGYLGFEPTSSVRLKAKITLIR